MHAIARDSSLQFIYFIVFMFVVISVPSVAAVLELFDNQIRG